jgi:hypothetical protein
MRKGASDEADASHNEPSADNEFERVTHDTTNVTKELVPK